LFYSSVQSKLSSDVARRASKALKEIIKTLSNRVSVTSKHAHFLSGYRSSIQHLILGSDHRTDAIILDGIITLAQQPMKEVFKVKGGATIDPPDLGILESLIPKIVQGLFDARKDGKWKTTQENAFVLIALDHYFRVYEKETPDFATKIWVGSLYGGEMKFKGRSTDESLLPLPMATLLTTEPDKAKKVIISKKGAGRLYYRIAFNYAPSDMKLPSLSRGFVVTRSYKGADNDEDVVVKDGKIKVRSGSRVRVVVTCDTDGFRYHVALVDNLPAGLEAQSPSLDRSQDSGGNSWYKWYDHRNFRDTRVEMFTTHLWPGTCELSFVAVAVSKGTYLCPPARAEEMYNPDVFGHSESMMMEIA